MSLVAAYRVVMNMYGVLLTVLCACIVPCSGMVPHLFVARMCGPYTIVYGVVAGCMITTGLATRYAWIWYREYGRLFAERQRVITSHQTALAAQQSLAESSLKKLAVKQAEYDTLRNELTNTKALYATLEKRHEELGRQHADLNTKHDDLKKEHQQTLTVVNTQATLVQTFTASRLSTLSAVSLKGVS